MMKRPSATVSPSARAGSQAQARGLALAALAASLVWNLWFLFHLPARSTQTGSVVSNGDAHSPPAERVETNRPNRDTPGENVAWRWDSLAEQDFSRLRQQLRTAGCPEYLVRAILEVSIDRAYRPRLLELFYRTQGNYWDREVVVKTGRKPPPSPELAQDKQAFAALQEERDRTMREFVGDDWERRRSYQDVSDGDPRLNYLSADKRERIAAQHAAVWDLRHTLRNQGLPEKEVQQQVQALEAEQSSHRADFLTPQEAKEYRLRHSRYDYVVQNLYSLELSVGERERIIQLHETYEGKVPDTELARALGADRFAQYQRAHDRSYQALYQVGSYLNLSETQITQAFDLKQAAGEQAKSIWAQRGLDRAERIERLAVLREVTRANLGEQLGPTGRDLYLKNGGEWIERLTEAPQ
jgi:hypothetical protein